MWVHSVCLHTVIVDKDLYEHSLFLFNHLISLCVRLTSDVGQADHRAPFPRKHLSEDGFERQWNFPNCIGALDGKHVDRQVQPGSGSLYFNYKDTFSMVRMALVDHQCCFTVVNIGAYGRNNDGGISERSLCECSGKGTNASCYCRRRSFPFKNVS